IPSSALQDARTVTDGGDSVTQAANNTDERKRSPLEPPCGRQRARIRRSNPHAEIQEGKRIDLQETRMVLLEVLCWRETRPGSRSHEGQRRGAAAASSAARAARRGTLRGTRCRPNHVGRSGRSRYCRLQNEQQEDASGRGATIQKTPHTILWRQARE